MIRAIREFFKELWTPSNQIGQGHLDYDRGAQAVWHGVLGATGAIVLAFLSLPASAGFVALLYAFKEVWDVSSGGTVWDSIEDIGAVWIGAATYMLPAFPLVLMMMGISLMFTAIIRK